MGQFSFETADGAALRHRIQTLLSAKDYNRYELGRALLVRDATARKYIKALEDEGNAHITSWRGWGSDTALLACYSYGPGENTPRPKYDQKLVNARTRARIRADVNADERARFKERNRRTPDEKAEQYRKWKEEKPEEYRAMVEAANERRRNARALRHIEQQEKAAERQRIEVLRAVRREAKNIPEYYRDRYVAVQTTIRNPRPDPLVGLFFGVRA